MPTKKKLEKKLHWTQTPEGKIKIKAIGLKKRILAKEPETPPPALNTAYYTAQAAPKLPNQYVDSIKVIDSVWALRKFMEEFFAKGVELAQRKNHDYTLSGDPFYNFKRAGVNGFIVRLQDKFARIESLATHGTLAVTEEKFEDTLIDIANYAALLAAFLYNQRAELEKRR